MKEGIVVEIWPPRPLSGQHAGPGPQGVRVTHYPSGFQASSVDERSQHKNKAIAMSMIEAALTHPFYRGSTCMDALPGHPEGFRP